MVIHTKTPGEVLDYTMDWRTVHLEVGENITASTWAVDPATDLVIDNDEFTNDFTVVWLSGGTLGVTYDLTNHVTTSEGREIDWDFQLLVWTDSSPDFGGCIWPVDPGCLTDTWNGYADDVRTRAVSLASATLSRLTAYRVSNCTIKARPAPQTRSCAVSSPGWSGHFIPALFQGSWVNTVVNPQATKDLVLPAPISRVDEIKIDGAVLNPADYVVYNRDTITYVGADDDFSWPRSQDFTKPDTEVGTFSVTYLNAYPIDATGAQAAGLLALEFAKACAGDGKNCRLPGNVRQIVRQGLSIDVVGGSFPNGLTGIREIDSFTSQWNVGGRARPMLFDPGAPKHRIQTS